MVTKNMKNMWSSGFWTYDVHVMDSAADQPFVRIGRVDLIDVVARSGVLAPAPWRPLRPGRRRRP